MKRILICGLASFAVACTAASNGNVLLSDTSTGDGKTDSVSRGGLGLKIDPRSAEQPLVADNQGVATLVTADKDVSVMTSRYGYDPGVSGKITLGIGPLSEYTGYDDLKQGTSVRFELTRRQTCPALNDQIPGDTFETTIMARLDAHTVVSFFESAAIDPAAGTIQLHTTFLDGSSFDQEVPLHEPCVIEVDRPAGVQPAPDSDPATRKYFVVPMPRSSANGDSLDGNYGYDLTATCENGTC